MYHIFRCIEILIYMYVCVCGGVPIVLLRPTLLYTLRSDEMLVLRPDGPAV